MKAWGGSAVTAQEFKTIAQAMGVDLIGVAPVERFAIFSPEASPLAIQPQTRSVIVLGFSIPRGALQGMETGTASYTLGMGIPTSVAIDTTYLLCRHLEAEGWEATPLFRQSCVMRNLGVRASAIRPEPNVIL